MRASILTLCGVLALAIAVSKDNRQELSRSLFAYQLGMSEDEAEEAGVEVMLEKYGRPLAGIYFVEDNGAIKFVKEPTTGMEGSLQFEWYEGKLVYIQLDYGVGHPCEDIEFLKQFASDYGIDPLSGAKGRSAHLRIANWDDQTYCSFSGRYQGDGCRTFDGPRTKCCYIRLELMNISEAKRRKKHELSQEQITKESKE